MAANACLLERRRSSASARRGASLSPSALSATPWASDSPRTSASCVTLSKATEAHTSVSSRPDLA